MDTFSLVTSVITPTYRYLDQRIALLRLQGKDGYQDALLNIARGDQTALVLWSQPFTAEERQQRRELIFEMWLAGYTEREIAKQLSISQPSICESLKKITRSPLELVITEQPPTYNVWNFNRCDPRFGQDHPGRIPGQAVIALLLWLTEPHDFVVDPMAGGGTTVDVCKYLQRRYYCCDIDPRRPDIRQWDIRQGYPRLPRKPNLIFLDPPYWRLKRDEYSSDGSAMGSYED